jgi:hypothetical protein
VEEEKKEEEKEKEEEEEDPAEAAAKAALVEAEDEDDAQAAASAAEETSAGAARLGADEGQEDVELYHADYGVVVSWRLIEGRAASPNAHGAAEAVKFQDKSSLAQRAQMEEAARRLTRGEAPLHTPFLLLALPDATMTLEALAVSLRPLVGQHRAGGVLLLGLPGLPHTHWPPPQPLTAPHQARAVASLLAHLVASGRLRQYLHPGVPVFWLGVGNGAMPLFHLACHALQPPDSGDAHAAAASADGRARHSGDPLRLLREQTVLFTAINGFAYVDKSLEKATLSLQRLLLRGTYHERLAALTLAHFGDDFVARKVR